MQRRIVDMNQEIHIQKGVLSGSSEKIEQSLAFLTNLCYKFYLSSEFRFIAIQEQQGEFCLRHLDAVEQIRPKMSDSRP